MTLSPLTGTDAAEREQRAKFVCTMPSRKEEDESQGVWGWVTHIIYFSVVTLHALHPYSKCKGVISN